MQLEMEKSRISQREAKASDFAKDPSNIEVRDKEGYFKVSKFRQIWFYFYKMFVYFFKSFLLKL